MHAVQAGLPSTYSLVVGGPVELLERLAVAVGPIAQEVVEHLLPRLRVDPGRLRATPSRSNRQVVIPAGTGAMPSSSPVTGRARPRRGGILTGRFLRGDSGTSFRGARATI